MDFSVSRVAVVAPRASVSAMRSAVSSGHLICTKCTSDGGLDAGVAQRRAHARRDGVDLREAPKMLERQRRRARAPDRQRAARNRRFDLARLEHEEMRRERAFRAAGHHEARRLGVAVPAVPAQSVLQSARSRSRG